MTEEKTAQIAYKFSFDVHIEKEKLTLLRLTEMTLNGNSYTKYDTIEIVKTRDGKMALLIDGDNEVHEYDTLEDAIAHLPEYAFRPPIVFRAIEELTKKGNVKITIDQT